MNNDKRKELDCREAMKLIAEYVDKQTNEQDCHDLEKHLESCQHCFDRVEFDKLLKHRLQGLKIDVSSMKLSPKAKRFLEEL